MRLEPPTRAMMLNTIVSWTPALAQSDARLAGIFGLPAVLH
jgi:hypothetical protein